MLNGPDWCCSIIAGSEEMTDFKLYTIYIYTYIIVIYYTQSVCRPVRIFLFVFMDGDKNATENSRQHVERIKTTESCIVTSVIVVFDSGAGEANGIFDSTPIETYI